MDDLREKMIRHFGDGLGWFALVFIHGSTVPVVLAALQGSAVLLPPLSMVGLIWFGLLLFFAKSVVDKNYSYMVTNCVGFFIQSILLGLLVFK